MPRTPGNADSIDIQKGMEVLVAARSMEDIQRAIEKLPILSHPTFHAVLHANIQRPDVHNSLRTLINSFFNVFSIKIHNRFFESVPVSKTLPARTTDPVYLPPFFKEFSTILNHRTPPDQAWVLDPAVDMERLLVEMKETIGYDTPLPVYQPTPGSNWNAVVVLCAACRHLWVNIRAYLVDLTIALDLLEPLRNGQLNRDACPNCGEHTSMPSRIWVQEPPGSGDTLAGLSTIYRLAPMTFVYMPPAGTKREATLEKMHECRFSSLFQLLQKNFRFIPKPGVQKQQLNIRVAYSRKTLIDFLNEVNHPTDDDLPIAMKDLKDEVARNMRSGLWPVHRAVDIVKGMQTPEWCLWPTLEYLSLEGVEVYQRLAFCMIREAVADAREEPLEVIIKLSLDSSESYLLNGQLGMAETALVKAEDSFSVLPLKEANDNRDETFSYELLRNFIGITRVKLLDALGNTQEATALEGKILGKLEDSSLFADDVIAQSIMHLSVISARAIELRQSGNLTEALILLRSNIEKWEELVASFQHAKSARKPIHYKEVLRHFSADLANEANVLRGLKEHLKVVRIFSQMQQPDGPNPSDIEWLKGMMAQGKNIKKVFDNGDTEMMVLEDMFPRVSERVLWQAAGNLFQRALQLAEETESWEFATIQSGHLTGLYFEDGNYPAAEQQAQHTLVFADKGGDQAKKISIYSTLAKISINQAEGASGLEWLRLGILGEARRLISMGHHAQADLFLHGLLAELAFESVDAGANAAQAVMLVENLKAVTTAFSLESKRPDQQPDTPSPESTNANVLQKRLEKYKLASMFDPAEQNGSELARMLEEISETTIDTSLRDQRFAEWVDSSEFGLLSVEGIRKRLQLLGPATTFIGAFVHDGLLWSYLINSEACLVSKHNFPSPPSESEHPYLDAAYLKLLSTVLLEPFISYLDNLSPHDHVIFSLCDGLYEAPMSALPFRDGMLCEYVIFSMVQGAGVLVACLERPHLNFRTALCIGGPLRPDMELLPGAIEEAKAISTLFESLGDEAKTLLPQHATIANLKQYATSYDVVHLACHAEMNDSKGGHLQLMLATDLIGEDSGELSERRILAELRLRAGSLVNLAACSSGIQSDKGRPLVSGLIPVILLSGAAGVIGTLWPIQDDLAASFQVQFYNFLLSGKSPEESLALTQRLCKAGNAGADMSDPVIWSAFQLYGCAAHKI